jgi:ABC-type phosphate transport system auxiliary subunit
MAHDELDHLREQVDLMMNNHLQHIQQDVTELKTKVAVIDSRMEGIEAFLRQNFSRLLLGLLAIAGAAVGIPASEMVGA